MYNFIQKYTNYNKKILFLLLGKNYVEPDESFLNNYFQDEQKGSLLVNHYAIKYRNFDLIEENINQRSFIDLVKYDYYTLVSLILNIKKIDINETVDLNNESSKGTVKVENNQNNDK